MKARGNQVGLFVLSLLTIAISQAVYAEDAQVLDEMVVSGSRSAEKLSETPVSIGVVSNNALKRDKPKTIGEAINRVAGVSWVDLGNEQHMMGIRQPNSTQAVYQYLEDGIPIRPLGVFNHNSLNELNLAGADHVEVVKGAASSLYGSNAVGGAVNFITAPSSPTPEASIGFRNEAVNGFQRVDTTASNTWGDFGVRFSHYSSRRSADNWQHYSNGNKDSATLRSDYALNASSLIHAVLSYNNLDSATPGSLNPSDYHSNPGKSSNTFSWRKDKSTRLSVAWEGETLNNGLTTATLFGRQNDHGQLPNYTYSNCTATTGAATCVGTLNNNHVSSLGFDLKHQQDFSWLSSRLIAGLYYDRSPNSYKSDNLTVTRSAANIYTSYVLNPARLVGVRNYKADITNTALFAQWELSPLNKVRVVAGGRLDSINYNFSNFLVPAGTALGSATNRNYGALSESRSFARFSPKIGSTYALSDSASVYANISQGFTPPEVSALYGKAVTPDLKPATYDSYEMGLRTAYFDGALKLDATLYRLDGHDTIVSFTPYIGTVAQASTNVNAGQTRSSGLELNLAWKAGALDARLAASLASHRYVTYLATQNGAVNYSGKEISSAPDTLTAEIGYQPVKDVRVALEMVKQSSYWMNDLNTVRYDGHTLFNLRGNYKFTGGWEAWLQGRNLTNQLYSDSASSSYNGTAAYSAAGNDKYNSGSPRSLMLGLNYAFNGKK